MSNSVSSLCVKRSRALSVLHQPQTRGIRYATSVIHNAGQTESLSYRSCRVRPSQNHVPRYGWVDAKRSVVRPHGRIPFSSNLTRRFGKSRAYSNRLSNGFPVNLDLPLQGMELHEQRVACTKR